MKVPNPTSSFRASRSSKGTRNLPRIWLWRPVGFDYRTVGNRDTHLGSINKILSTPGPRGKEQGPPLPQETESDLLSSVGGSPMEVWVNSGSPQALATAVLGGAPWWAFFQVIINPIIDPVDPRAGLPRAKQLTKRECNTLPISRQLDYFFFLNLSLHWICYNIASACYDLFSWP